MEKVGRWRHVLSFVLQGSVIVSCLFPPMFSQTLPPVEFKGNIDCSGMALEVTKLGGGRFDIVDQLYLFSV